jgi:hypothetical protein
MPDPRIYSQAWAEWMLLTSQLEQAEDSRTASIRWRIAIRRYAAWRSTKSRKISSPRAFARSIASRWFFNRSVSLRCRRYSASSARDSAFDRRPSPSGFGALDNLYRQVGKGRPHSFNEGGKILSTDTRKRNRSNAAFLDERGKYTVHLGIVLA